MQELGLRDSGRPIRRLPLLEAQSRRREIKRREIFGEGECVQKKEWLVMVVVGGGESGFAGDCSTALCTRTH